jgi:hypothetical protein
MRVISFIAFPVSSLKIYQAEASEQQLPDARRLIRAKDYVFGSGIDLAAQARPLGGANDGQWDDGRPPGDFIHIRIECSAHFNADDFAVGDLLFQQGALSFDSVQGPLRLVVQKVGCFSAVATNKLDAVDAEFSKNLVRTAARPF